MDTKMTSWTLNILLAGMAAIAVILPQPDEIRKAIEYGQSSPPIQIEKTSGEALIQIDSAAPSYQSPTVSIDYAPTVKCLRNLPGAPTERVSECIPALLNAVVSYDQYAKARIARGATVYPNPDVEAARMALINLCRVRWSMQPAPKNSPAPTDCRAITVGVAY